MHLDRARMKDTETVSKFAAELNDTPLHPWDTPLNQQAQDSAETYIRLASKHFKTNKLTTRKPYITRETMKLVRLRRYARTAYRNFAKGMDGPFDLLARGMQYDELVAPEPYTAWALWYYRLQLATYCTTTGGFPTTDLATEVNAFLSDTSKLTKRMLMHDRLQFLRSTASRIPQDAALGNSADEWRNLKRLLRFGGRKAAKGTPAGTLRQRPNGKGGPALSNEEADAAMVAHFASVEDAALTTTEGVAMEYNGQGNQAALHLDFDIQLVPSIYDLQRLFSSAKRGKATGPDMIPDDLLKATAQASARFWHPTMVKTVLYSQEPISFKQGVLCVRSTRRGHNYSGRTSGTSYSTTQSASTTTDSCAKPQ